ncbi:MAG: putative murein peptide carboxypeptidase [Chroococcopsis gigantea SAG 12.99]|jgi:muramoyltetrapeptide carboxypeptidase|nr:LD-carboxypeptidase [Chlorogloea purpurea SAG 13.99]MDV3000238.1 putative murein peptide carboxypeptidase [Chroococcopsis gigantea SAG 12.99]
MKTPVFLQPGDSVYVVATSGALKELDNFHKGVDIWQKRGYQIKYADNWPNRFGYLAGTDEQRRQGLKQALNDRDCQAILVARGGYGSARLLEDWQWGETYKWIIGFSDVTGLLWSLARHGVGSLHAPLLTTLALEPQWSIDRLFAAVEGRELPPLQGQGWNGKKATGWLLPANLTVATHLLGTSSQPDLKGAILALEDVTEAPYRIDRMLTQWRMLGLLDDLAGIALGRFSRCEAPPDSPSFAVEEVLRDRLAGLPIPIVADLPFGHDGVNATLPLGANVELDAEKGSLEILPSP